MSTNIDEIKLRLKSETYSLFFQMVNIIGILLKKDKRRKQILFSYINFIFLNLLIRFHLSNVNHGYLIVRVKFQNVDLGKHIFLIC